MSLIHQENGTITNHWKLHLKVKYIANTYLSFCLISAKTSIKNLWCLTKKVLCKNGEITKDFWCKEMAHKTTSKQSNKKIKGFLSIQKQTFVLLSIWVRSYLVDMPWNLSIYNIICRVAWTMGQTNRWPSVWCSKYYFFSWFLAKLFAKILSNCFLIF